jgi:O-glycosyl hydrolase
MAAPAALAFAVAAALISATAASDADAQSFTVDLSSRGQAFQGVGALSGGGGVTRMLIDYPVDAQADILDMLFGPSGAALQIIKIEIGGDTQSTEGASMSGGSAFHPHA